MVMLKLAVAISVLHGSMNQKEGVLLMAHGGDRAWNEQVTRIVAPLQDDFPIEIAFGMAQTSTIRDAVARLEKKGARRIAVVRMFVSGDSFLAETEYILGLRKTLPHCAAHPTTAAAGSSPPAGGDTAHAHGHDDQAHDGHHMEPPEPIATQCSFVLSRRGVAESPLVDQILVDRVRKLSERAETESVLLLAHGPADDDENRRWLDNMRQRAGRIRELGPFRDVRCETLREDWPEKRAESERRIRDYVRHATRDGGRCIVVPFRVSGFGPYEGMLKGLDYVADKQGFCPHPNMMKWIEQAARECLDPPAQRPREARQDDAP